jgi:putative ABC transport system permease protein
MDIHGDRPELGSALDRTERYLGLSSIVVIITSGVAIAMATRRYSERHLDTAAILRCLGGGQRRVFGLFLCQFVVLGFIVSALGCAFGWGLQEVLFALLKDLLPKAIAKPDWLAALTGMLTGVLVLMGFALPPLLRLKRIPPMRILRRDLEPLPVSGWLTYGLSGLLVSALIWRYTGDAKMTMTILGTGVIALLALMLLLKGLLVGARAYLPKLGLNWRFGLQSLVRNSKASLSQIIGFTITLVAMTLSFVVRNDLLDTWQKQLPDNAPNYFVVNVFPDQVKPLQLDLDSQNIQGSRFYPVVRGRLTEINAVPVQKVVSKDTQGENATHRELSLTWSSNLPEENHIVAGQWDYANNPHPGQVSVEQKLAESLNIKVGDNLLFVIGGQRLTAVVASIRSLQWDTMKPNFYMIFSPGTLESYPTTYISSFHLSAGQKTFLNQLVKKYPAITLLEVDQILKQFKTLLKQLTGAINYLLYFALAAGFTVLFSAIYSSLDNRLYESALLRTFGASRGLLRRSHWIEFGLVGLVSGLLAMVMTEALLYALYSRVLHIDYWPSWYLWLALPVISTLAVSVAGTLATRRVVTTPPLRVLRNL